MYDGTKIVHDVVRGSVCVCLTMATGRGLRDQVRCRGSFSCTM